MTAWSAPDSSKKREWLDYHLRYGEAVRLVVEAKRAGKTFSVPTARKTRKLPLKQLKENHGDALGKAIHQSG